MSGLATTRICAALVGALLAAPLTAAQAQEPSSAQRDAIRASCRSDFMANCGGVQPGGKEAFQCLQHNAAKLSPACKTEVSAIAPPAAPAAAAPPAKTAHPPAATAHPPNAPQAAATPPAAPPPSPTVASLKLRLFIMPQRRLAIASICAGDIGRLCQGVTPGGEQELKCLAAQAAALTPQCYEALARVSER